MKSESRLLQINEQAALTASRTLSKLIDRPVGIEITKTGVKDVEELSPIIDSEEIVAGIYLPITGDVKGAALLIFPKETAFTLSDLLVRREPGTTRKLSELDKSALKEVGNIVSGNYFTVLSNNLQVKIIEHIPSFSFDMFGAIISQIIAKFAQEAEKALVIEVEFIFKPVTPVRSPSSTSQSGSSNEVKLKGYFLLLFRVEELKAILGDFKV